MVSLVVIDVCDIWFAVFCGVLFTRSVDANCSRFLIGNKVVLRLLLLFISCFMGFFGLSIDSFIMVWDMVRHNPLPISPVIRCGLIVNGSLTYSLGVRYFFESGFTLVRRHRLIHWFGLVLGVVYRARIEFDSICSIGISTSANRWRAGANFRRSPSDGRVSVKIPNLFLAHCRWFNADR